MLGLLHSQTCVGASGLARMLREHLLPGSVQPSASLAICTLHSKGVHFSRDPSPYPSREHVRQGYEFIVLLEIGSCRAAIIEVNPRPSIKHHLNLLRDIIRRIAAAWGCQSGKTERVRDAGRRAQERRWQSFGDEAHTRQRRSSKTQGTRPTRCFHCHPHQPR